MADKIRDHVRKAHGAEPNATLVDYLVEQAAGTRS